MFTGNLYFANIVPTDDLAGKNYVCIVQNDKLRSMSQGDDAHIVPYVSGTPPPNAREKSIMCRLLLDDASLLQCFPSSNLLSFFSGLLLYIAQA